jgi:hypothetical protein
MNTNKILFYSDYSTNLLNNTRTYLYENQESYALFSDVVFEVRSGRVLQSLSQEKIISCHVLYRVILNYCSPSRRKN